MAEPSPQDRFATPGSPGGSSAAFPRWSAAQRAGSDQLDPSPLLLPAPDESPVAYLARLKALHQRLGALIATIEQRRQAEASTPLTPPAPMSQPILRPRPPESATPVVAPPRAPLLRPPLERPAENDSPWPVRERRAGDERRLSAADRRHGLGDRRRGGPDARADRTERRAGARDRRVGATDRRRGVERRRIVNSLPWERGGLRLNAVTMVWVVQVLAWAAIAAVALVYGLGHS